MALAVPLSNRLTRIVAARPEFRADAEPFAHAYPHHRAQRAGGCLEIASARGDNAHCYLVRYGSTRANLSLTAGRGATDFGNLVLTAVRHFSGAYRITSLMLSTGEPWRRDFSSRVTIGHMWHYHLAIAAHGDSYKERLMALLDVPAPMAGSIKEVLVAPGDRVAAGQEILVLESMKMEIPVESPGGGTVLEVHVAPSQRIDEGQLLLRIETA